MFQKLIHINFRNMLYVITKQLTKPLINNVYICFINEVKNHKDANQRLLFAETTKGRRVSRLKKTYARKFGYFGSEK